MRGPGRIFCRGFCNARAPDELLEVHVSQVLDKLLALAAKQNVTGTVDPAEPGAEPAGPVEEPLPPHHQEAYDAIAEGHFQTAIRKYTRQSRKILAISSPLTSADLTVL